MSGRRLLIAAGVAGFLLFLIGNVPARLAADLLGTAGLRAGSATGTLWRGEFASLNVAGISLGRTRWNLKPLSLLLGRLAADVDVDLPGGFLRGRAEVGLGGRIGLSDAQAASPLKSLGQMFGLPVDGGEASAKITQLVLEDGWPTVAVGEVRVGNVPLALPGVRAEPGAEGSFLASFDNPQLAPGDSLVGELRDLGGALELSGSVELLPPNNYNVAGLLKPRAEAPDSLTQGLVLLGPEDAQGRREFALGGSF